MISPSALNLHIRFGAANKLFWAPALNLPQPDCCNLQQFHSKPVKELATTTGPSGILPGTWPEHAQSSGTLPGAWPGTSTKTWTFRNLAQNLPRNLLRNLTRKLHRSTPELIWAEDTICSRCWGRGKFFSSKPSYWTQQTTTLSANQLFFFSILLNIVDHEKEQTSNQKLPANQ